MRNRVSQDYTDPDKQTRFMTMLDLLYKLKVIKGWEMQAHYPQPHTFKDKPTHITLSIT